jgi:hypothetical protein
VTIPIQYNMFSMHGEASITYTPYELDQIIKKLQEKAKLARYAQKGIKI